MGIRKHTPEQILAKLREAEVLLAQGETIPKVSRRQVGINFDGLCFTVVVIDNIMRPAESPSYVDDCAFNLICAWGRDVSSDDA